MVPLTTNEIIDMKEQEGKNDDSVSVRMKHNTFTSIEPTEEQVQVLRDLHQYLSVHRGYGYTSGNSANSGNSGNSGSGSGSGSGIVGGSADIDTTATATATATATDTTNCVNRTTTSTHRLLLDNTAMAVPVAAMKTLLNVVQRSKAETMMGLQHELQIAAQLILLQQQQQQQQLQQQNTRTSDTTNTSTTHTNTISSYSISLQSGIELFLRYITRSYLETPNFNDCRLQVLQRGQHFQQLSYTARDRIAMIAHDFILPNTTILTIGFSRVVASILNEASKTKHFDIIVLEGSSGSNTSSNHNNQNQSCKTSSTGSNDSPASSFSENSDYRTAQCYHNEMNIPVTVVNDAAMGYILEQRNVSMVLVGSYVVVENGGVINKCGTYTLAMCAHTLNIPFYVAAESYKFARLYPLHQSDIPYNDNNNDSTSASATGATSQKNGNELQYRYPNVDLTPAKYITLLFTDLGVLTTSAVSDELIRLYQ
jgi:translation initiation factor eIF-2B subunit alpha